MPPQSQGQQHEGERFAPMFLPVVTHLIVALKSVKPQAAFWKVSSGQFQNIVETCTLQYNCSIHTALDKQHSANTVTCLLICFLGLCSHCNPIGSGSGPTQKQRCFTEEWKANLNCKSHEHSNTNSKNYYRHKCSYSWVQHVTVCN